MRQRLATVGLVVAIGVGAFGCSSRDYTNLAWGQGFMASTPTVTEMVIRQVSSGGTLTGSIQETTMTAPISGCVPAGHTAEQIALCSGSSRSSTVPISGHINGSNVVFTVTHNGSVVTTFEGKVTADGLHVTYPASDTTCGGTGNVTQTWKLTTGDQYNAAADSMSGVAKPCR